MTDSSGNIPIPTRSEGLQTGHSMEATHLNTLCPEKDREREREREEYQGTDETTDRPPTAGCDTWSEPASQQRKEEKCHPFLHSIIHSYSR